MEVGEGQFLKGLEEIPGKPSWGTQGQGQDLNWHGKLKKKKQGKEARASHKSAIRNSYALSFFPS